MTYQISCIGEPLAEISDNGGLTIGFGGDALNTAVYCARTAGKDVNVRIITVLGDDVLSHGAMRFMKEEGVDTDFVCTHPTRNMGIYAIRNDSDGERYFHYWRNQSAARTLFATSDGLEYEAITSSAMIFLSGITVAILPEDARHRLLQALQAARANGASVAFDSNYRPRLWHSLTDARSCIERFWKVASIGLPTIEDEQAVFGDETDTSVIRRLKSYGVPMGALKCGAFGPRLFPETTQSHEFLPSRHVIDTTGAGDSFNGTFLAQIASGYSPAQAAYEAHNCARRVVSSTGAILPRWQTDEFTKPDRKT